MRIATFNVSLAQEKPGALIEVLGGPPTKQISRLLQIINIAGPDILVLGEFDYDEGGQALTLFAEALGTNYRHQLALPSNTGEPSGFDLDDDGYADHPPETQGYARDAKGYGRFPGQYAMALLSKFPIDQEAVRTFKDLPWSDLPGAMIPPGALERKTLPLSSKSHAIVPIRLHTEKVLHILTAHPTPPTFDGPEDTNGKRNHDEIALLAAMIGGDAASWLVDDQGRRGPLPRGAAFVIAGDMNADPEDGEAASGPHGRAIHQLTKHPLVQALAPSSLGGAEAAERQGRKNSEHQGDPAHDTADFRDSTAGNLRTDYLLPSRNLKVVDSGVFWPAMDEPYAALVGPGYPIRSSDHRLVWADLSVPGCD